MTSPGINEQMKGDAKGRLLNALGFMFFNKDREYYISAVDKRRIVEVSAWESEDGPDEDGYGREDYYDWWFLDEHLTLPEGVGYLHSYSSRDKSNHPEKFETLYEKAAEAVADRKRKQNAD